MEANATQATAISGVPLLAHQRGYNPPRSSVPTTIVSAPLLLQEGRIV